jgi:glycosyltransferase involved in cell wall biosynthesis
VADEVIDDKETGLLVKQRSAESLSDAIVSLLKRPDEIRRLGENGYNKLLNKYSLKHSADRFEELITNYNK